MLGRRIRQDRLSLPCRVPRGREVPSVGSGVRAGEDDDLVLSLVRALYRPGREEVLLVVEPAFPLRAMQNAPVPIGTAPHDCGWANLEMTANARAVDDPAVAGLRHVEAALPVPLLGVGGGGKEAP